MTSWHPLVAHRAAANGDVKAPPDRLPHNLLLILRLHVFHLQRTPTVGVRTVRRRGNRDHFIDLFGNKLAMVPTIRAPGLAPRPPRVLLTLATGKRRCLSLVGTQRLLQLSLQLFVVLTQAVAFLF